MYVLARHWGSAERAPGHGSTGPPSELHPVLCGPLGEVLNHPARNSTQVQNVDHICQGRANLEPGKVTWFFFLASFNFILFSYRTVGRFEFHSNKETSTDLLDLWWPLFLHYTCSAADCLPCWAFGRLCNAVSLPRLVLHTCYLADRHSWIRWCSWRHAGRQQTGQSQQHHCRPRPQQTWGWGVSSCLGCTQSLLMYLFRPTKYSKHGCRQSGFSVDCYLTVKLS